MKKQNLVTIRSYADLKGFTTQHVYRLIKEEKLTVVEIDGVKFIDQDKKPKLKTK